MEPLDLNVDKLALDLEQLYRDRYVGLRDALATVTGSHDSARDALQEGLSISSAISRARESLSADTSVLGRRSQQVKGQPLRGLLANSGKMFQFIDESFDGSSKIGHAACVA